VLAHAGCTLGVGCCGMGVGGGGGGVVSTHNHNPTTPPRWVGCRDSTCQHHHTTQPTTSNVSKTASITHASTPIKNQRLATNQTRPSNPQNTNPTSYRVGHTTATLHSARASPKPIAPPTNNQNYTIRITRKQASPPPQTRPRRWGLRWVGLGCVLLRPHTQWLLVRVAAWGTGSGFVSGCVLLGGRAVGCGGWVWCDGGGGGCRLACLVMRRVVGGLARGGQVRRPRSWVCRM